MFNKAYLLSIFLVNFILTEAALKPLEPSENFAQTFSVDQKNPNQFQVFWSIVKNEIIIEVHVKTTGWIGIGLSPDGKMIGSDIAIGWVDNLGKAYIRDVFATSYSKLDVDATQDFSLIEGAELNGYTILKFKRFLKPCDAKNREITTGLQKLIFAWGDSDPTSSTSNDWKAHNLSNAFAESLNLLNYRAIGVKNNVTIDTTFAEMSLQNILVPVKDTFIYCNLFELPKFESPVHLIRYESIVNSDNVYSIMLYECDDNYAPTSPFSKECTNDVSFDILTKCQSKLVYVWGSGNSKNYNYPPQAGYRFKQTNKYVLMKIHYNKINTELRDSSGLKLYFSKTLRANDMGLLLVGANDVQLSLQIPPNAKSLSFSTTCYPDCTKKFVPDTGIYIVSALTQLYKLGKSSQVSVARDGKIFGHLLKEGNYDFKQQLYYDVEPIKISKSDAIVTKCTYDTSDKNTFTFRGNSIENDGNCVSYINYYPKIEGFQTCSSNLQPKFVYDFYRSLINETLMPSTFVLDDSKYYQNMVKFVEYINNQKNYSDKLVDKFQQFYSSATIEASFCGNSNEPSNAINVNITRYQPKELSESAKACLKLMNNAIKNIVSFKSISIILFSIYYLV